MNPNSIAYSPPSDFQQSETLLKTNANSSSDNHPLTESELNSMLQEFLRAAEWIEMPLLSFASNTPLRSAALRVVDPDLVDWKAIEIGGKQGEVSVGEVKNA